MANGHDRRDDLAVLMQRLMSCEAARDVEVERVVQSSPLAYLARRICRDAGLPESETLKVLVALMAADAERLQGQVVKLASLQPVTYVLPVAGVTSPPDACRAPSL